MIPALTGGGLLPPGRHPATIAEIEDFFVERAPHADHRRRIFRAFQLYSELIGEIVASGTFWVNGGFCTYKEEPPEDIDLAVLVDPTLPLTGKDHEKLASLITLKGVQAMEPQVLAARLQPMGGLIDSFLIVAGVVAQEEYWDETWSKVKGPDGQLIPGAVKGYLEVSW
ncbi:DUF6932 family protein [Streptomyces sp. AN091965]|uniref:DUF6932 family protein n=1 Tax=Streptomyces sp. AN091965 TaxID=2927803 RepID=UPI001F6110CF|nr:hypothetical protein [Streptomyces sp. AN091965]MCI3932098.1 hypothetical protein [Streptomyces sp. AN091965]